MDQCVAQYHTEYFDINVTNILPETKIIRTK